MLLDNYQNNFMVFLSPIGFGFFLVFSYIIQPIIVGALNVIILSRLYNTEGFQTSFWLNGLFLLLTFSTINLLIQQYGACLSPFHSQSSKPSHYQSPLATWGSSATEAGKNINPTNNKLPMLWSPNTTATLPHNNLNLKKGYRPPRKPCPNRDNF
jgi:hypothetical protein